MVSRMPDPKAVKPDDWDEDAPRQIDDPEDEKPEGWLDNEPEEIDDPGAWLETLPDLAEAALFWAACLGRQAGHADSLDSEACCATLCL